MNVIFLFPLRSSWTSYLILIGLWLLCIFFYVVCFYQCSYVVSVIFGTWSQYQTNSFHLRLSQTLADSLPFLTAVTSFITMIFHFYFLNAWFWWNFEWLLQFFYSVCITLCVCDRLMMALLYCHLLVVVVLVGGYFRLCHFGWWHWVLRRNDVYFVYIDFSLDFKRHMH